MLLVLVLLFALFTLLFTLGPMIGIARETFVSSRRATLAYFMKPYFNNYVIILVNYKRLHCRFLLLTG